MAPSSSSAALVTTVAVAGFSTSQAFVVPGGNGDVVREGRQQKAAVSTPGLQSGTTASEVPATATARLGLIAVGAAATAAALHRRSSAATQA
eukprot:CAMPEP_0185900646 /NCGR_PEP_ID=MMETSP0196C-20130402/142_1 /TAXON_ID=2932 /ORGANISM="Alexandrium fundyense, Strain CCMP1719" /LENGTH=91 /DNA_ID=CAMNT_0028619147 /DNA_START=110 /DNA_END=382 /DNA_ORIENTATION=+